MKKIASVALLFLFSTVNAFEFDIGLSGGDRGVDGFYFSVGEYYNVPEREIVVVERSIPREDINVAYFLATKARRDVRYITELRLSGKSWWDISLRLGLDPRTIYVVDTYNNYGPPYGKAYGYSKWDKHHRLNDSQILELVNVRFLSEYHRISPDEVIERRQKGSHYYKSKSDYAKQRDKAHRVKDDKHKKERQRDDYRGADDKYERNRYEDEKRGNSNGKGREH